MALVSPGLEITVTDESQYISNAVGTVPLVVLATAENKTINGTLATGTTEANAGALQVFGSQRDLSTAMGYPVFQQSSAGTPLHGNELNEYGLMAAYSALGLGNQLYAIRADIDLNELQGTSVRPTGSVASGTEWFDLADTSWGIYEWSADTQSFTLETPIVITSSSQTVSTTQGSLSSVMAPLQSIGQVGSYAVVASQSYSAGLYDNRIFYKAGNGIGSIDPNSLNNQWTLVGTAKWHQSHPTVVGTVASATVPSGTTLTINGTTVTISSGGAGTNSNAAVFAANVNAAAITGVKADVYNNKVALYIDPTANGNGTVIMGIGANTTAFSSFGLTANVVYNTTQFQYSNFASIPAWTNTVSGDLNAPNGSVWFKTGAVGGGFNFVFKEYNSLTGLWTSQAVNSYANNVAALLALDPAGGGSNIAAGTIIMRQDINPAGSTSLGYAGFRPRVRQVYGAVTGATGTLGSSPFTTNNSFTLAATQPGLSSYTTATVTLLGTGTSDFVAAVQRANIPNITATVTSAGGVSITHLAGGEIIMTNVVGTPLSVFTSSQTNVYLYGSVVNISGFNNLTYTYSTTQPVADPADGTLWYYSDPTVVDVMVNTGTAWVGYQNLSADARGYNLTQTDPNGVIASASQPATETDGTPLVAGDLWLDTSDLENWPKLSRYTGSAWVAIDNTDQVTSNGILFADARWDNSGTTDPASGTEVSTVALLTSNYLDLDAPNPQLYPRGMLLLNTRRSGYNVKKYVATYFTEATDGVATWNSGTTYSVGAKVYYGSTLYVAIQGSNTNQSPSSQVAYWTPLVQSSWVSTSGLKNDGSPYSGHYAQRQIIVAAMKAALDANTEIREEQFAFSLICAPGYPELIPDMVSLNNDRANTAFVIGDTPLTLSTNAVDLINWSNDTNGDGLATADPYLGVYYPSGLSSDLSGNTIMVPPSHMALRTFLYNDNVAYPWFAPAGTRRGLVSNATDIGYLNPTTGEFVRSGINHALRDTLYANKINPITIIPGIGLVVWGQKTRDPNTESMDRINVARLVNYLRTIFASAGNAFLFEPNDKITRDQFGAILSRALNDLVAKRGIYDYLVVCDTTNNTPDRIANNQLYADIAIEPMKDVEFIYIPIRLYNPGTIATLGGK